MKYALPTNLGRTAVFLALDAMRLGKGSRIGLPAIVCTTVIRAVLAAGCHPVIMDVGPDLHMQLAAEPKEELACVLVPHLYGLSAPIGQWEAWARVRGIKLIDDAAQAVGLKSDGRWLGTFGDVGIFSFGPLKNLSLLRGGVLITANSELAHRVRRNRNNLPRETAISLFCRIASGILKYQLGWKLKRPVLLAPVPVNHDVGLTNAKSSYPSTLQEAFQLSNVEAGLIHRALLRMDATLHIRSLAAKALRITLKKFEFLEFIGPIDAPSWKIPVRISKPIGAIEVLRYLRTHNIEAERIYKPLHLQDSFSIFAPQHLPGAEQCWQNTLLLPNPVLQGQEAIFRLIRAFEGFTKANHT